MPSQIYTYIFITTVEYALGLVKIVANPKNKNINNKGVTLSM